MVVAYAKDMANPIQPSITPFSPQKKEERMSRFGCGGEGTTCQKEKEKKCRDITIGYESRYDI